VSNLAAAVATELDLAAARAAARAHLEATADGAYILDPVRDRAGEIVDFVVADCNAGALAQTGRDRGAVVGRRLCETFPGHRPRGLFEAYARVATTGEPMERELQTSEPGVTVRWLRVRATRVGTRVAVRARDVSERRAAEDALREREARYRLLFEGNPLPMWVFDVETLAFLAVNDAAVAHYGYSRDEFLAMTIADIRPPGEVRTLLAAHASRGDGLNTHPMAFRHRQRSGRVIEVEITSHALEFAGRPAELVLAHDVTERRAAEAALRASEARQRALLEALPVIVYRVEPEPPHAPLYVSPRVEALGYTHAEWLARPDMWVSVLHPDDRARVLRDTAAALATGEAVEYEYRVVAKDGTVRWIHDRGDFVRDVEGRSTVWQGVMVDVTEQRATEAALAASEERLTLALGATQDGLWDWHVPTGAVHFSGRWMEMLGYAPGELPHRVETFQSLLHPEDAPRIAAALAAQFADAAHEYALEVRMRTREGAWRWVLTRGDVVERDGAGAPVRMVGTHVDVDARKALEAELLRQAQHDALTGLANRARFRERVERALARADRPAGSVTVLFLDLDDFKTVNDTLGHPAGDRLLSLVAERLLNATRGCDTVARLGGDEFAVLLENVRGDADAVAVAARATAAMRAPFDLDGRQASIGASVGIARATSGDTADTLLRNADLAMYRAKGTGKGRHETFAPEMHAALAGRVALAADLRQCVALLGLGDVRSGERDAEPPAHHGFSLVFQPMVELDSGRLVGMEALARWCHRTRGPMPPGEFIELAEQSGAVEPLGRWVLREACRAAARWDAASGGGLTPGASGAVEAGPVLHVNVSSRQLEAATFLGHVTDALRDSGFPAARLVVEITEGVLMRDAEATLARLHALKALGVRLAVDDFGTGYSSLAYLQRFPVDILKIDKAFVDGLLRGGAHAALARTVIALGDSLGLRTVAEGVEQPEQRDQLLALGCRVGQGYLFARPMPGAGAAEYLRGARDARRPPPAPARHPG
jgi:diguanylate cyclase (GGDEF)-like protein/PAS domain S-box-containing protein